MSAERTKTALVTGASRGIGRAIAVQLARAGFRIAVHYNTSRAGAEEALHQLAPGDHVVLGADLSNPEGAADLAHAALEAFAGTVDVLVHNAGIYQASAISTDAAGYDAWQTALRTQMQLNFFAGADLSYLLAPAMVKAGWGRIIQIASRAGIRGEARFSGYGASKAAQINFIKSLAVELAPSRVACFAIAPGWVETEMSAEALDREGESIRAGIPAGRVATPDDIAHLVAYLVTPAADYLTGNTIDVNGASHLR